MADLYSPGADPTGYKLQGKMRQDKRKNQQDHPLASIKRCTTELSLVQSLEELGEKAVEEESLVVMHPVEEPAPNEVWTRSDLASHLVPSEVPHEAETIQWHNSQVLPMVMHDGRNICEKDAQHVHQMAALLMLMPTSCSADHIEPKGLQDGDIHN
ncbi:hypothetical protein EDB19DRAFT_1827578 [Suillus lakei]|nr:hypothetical protein EDB19DRAFT_1827578 [Suillus lakei]